MLSFRQFCSLSTLRHFSASPVQCHRFTDQSNINNSEENVFSSKEGAPKESFMVFTEQRPGMYKAADITAIMDGKLGPDLGDVDTTGLGIGEPHSKQKNGVIPSFRERLSIDGILNPEYLNQQIRTARSVKSP